MTLLKSKWASFEVREECKFHNFFFKQSADSQLNSTLKILLQFGSVTKMKHLIAAGSDKDKLFSFPHQGQGNLSENRLLSDSYKGVTRVNSTTGTKTKQVTWQRKTLNDNLEPRLLQIQDKKQVAETWFKREPFLWLVPHTTSPLPRYIFCFTSTWSL